MEKQMLAENSTSCLNILLKSCSAKTDFVLLPVSDTSLNDEKQMNEEDTFERTTNTQIYQLNHQHLSFFGINRIDIVAVGVPNQHSAESASSPTPQICHSGNQWRRLFDPPHHSFNHLSWNLELLHVITVHLRWRR